MNSSNSSLGPGRLTGESSRAYQAFRTYRDLGPGRSLDLAYESFCSVSNPGKLRRSARRPGYWAEWSHKFNWVERAEAYDDLIDETRRKADEELERKLQDRRAQFAIEAQEQTQDLARKLHSTFDKMMGAPLTEVIRVQKDPATGIKTSTKVKALNGRELAELARAVNETIRFATRGDGVKAVEEKERQIDRVVWAVNEKANQDPEREAASDAGYVGSLKEALGSHKIDTIWLPRGMKIDPSWHLRLPDKDKDEDEDEEDAA